MPMDPSFVGRTYPPSPPYEVSRVKIAEFADALGDPNPVYRDPAAARAAGYPDVIAPPTFAFVISSTAGEAVIFDPELGLDYSRVVHGEQSFRFQRPLHAGDVVQVVVSVSGIRTLAGNDLITTLGEVSTVAGEHVLSATTTLVSRGAEAGS